MPTFLRLRNQEYRVKPGLTVREAMMKHDIRPERVIPIRDGELITEDEIVREGDTIRLVPVISGGGARLIRARPSIGNAQEDRPVGGRGKQVFPRIQSHVQTDFET